MSLTLRQPNSSDLEAASQLCLRSKGYWGYDDAFLAMCEEELTLTETDLAQDRIVVAEDQNGMAGVAQVSLDESGCYLEKLFVDTDRIGQGVGRVLYDWAFNTARDLGAHELILEGDPGAAPFYERMGCVRAGEAKSGSISGRTLPRFIHKLG